MRIHCAFAGKAMTLLVLVAPSPAWASDVETSLFSGNIWNAIWALAVFTILLLVLGRFGWRPIIKVLKDREDRIALALSESESSRKQAEELLEQYRKQLAAAQSEAARLVAQAQTEAEKAGRLIVDEARSEADESRRRAIEQIEASKNAAVAALFQEAADLAAQAAGQILKREIRPDEHRQLVEQTLAEIGRDKVM